MRGYEYILAKQTSWARNQGLSLVGSQGDRGRPAYLPHLDDNLFEPLLPDVYEAFAAGKGGELGDGGIGKMQAVHSSSALAVNVFQYWQRVSNPSVIAAACGLCSRESDAPARIRFEVTDYAVNDAFPVPPNIDVVIECGRGSRIAAFGIECKFSEAYGSHRHGGLKPRYLSECSELWSDLPRLSKLASAISPDDDDFKYLHPAQLLKHLLALKRQFGPAGFRLMYLWYDVPGADGAAHRGEIDRFAQSAKEDGVHFHSMSYQELIVKLASSLQREHADYVSYLTGRYL
jgi:hypothetical protein